MWVVSIHHGGGSMAEAVDVEFAFSLPGEPQAKQVCEAINAALSNAGEDYKMAQYFEVIPAGRIAWPQPDPAEVTRLIKEMGRPPGLNEAILDIAKWVEQYLEAQALGRPFPKLKPKEPDPVTPEEEADAIRRLTGGTE